jgi:predicted Zn-dependent peptidase
VRLRVPFAGRSAHHSARAAVLAETLLSGTASLSTVDVAVALQEIGGSLHVNVDPDRLLVSGNALATGLPRLLEIIDEVLTGAAYPAEDVAGERDRLVERLRIARAQPSVIAREALLQRMYGDHPYAHEIPADTAVAAVTRSQLRALHRSRVVPGGSTLVIVGDVSPGRTLDRAEATLSSWDSAAKAQAAPPLPKLEAGPILLVDRPGAVQSNIRLGGPALPRQDPQYAAMQLANMVYGGYFSSRLVENIREDKGYTYHARSYLEFTPSGATILVEADTASGVTAPALLETRYELARLGLVPPSGAEVESVRQYAIGSLLIATASQAGLAAQLTGLLAVGLGPDWLRLHPERLAEVTAEQIAEAALEFFAPSRFTGVVVGDAGLLAPQLTALGGVQLP